MHLTRSVPTSRVRSEFIESLEGRRMLVRSFGIDVSHYQTVSSWASVYAAGKNFVWAKASEGATYTDPAFATHMAGATAAGVIAGAYHFARPDNNAAVTEANKFLSVASAYIGPGFLKPACDIEVSSLSKAATSTWVNTFCNTVLNATGVRPVVYSGASFASTKLDSTVTQWSPWIASYNGQSATTGNPTSTTPWTNWSFWQNSQTGTVSGISGNVDTDVYANDVNALINNHVGKSTLFSVGQTVHVTASSLKAWDTYASNGTYVSKPNGTTATIQGGPVYVNGFQRWKVLYSGDSVATWSAGDYLAAGASRPAAPGDEGPSLATVPTRPTAVAPRLEGSWSLIGDSDVTRKGTFSTALIA
jgi:lysozyme